MLVHLALGTTLAWNRAETKGRRLGGTRLSPIAKALDEQIKRERSTEREGVEPWGQRLKYPNTVIDTPKGTRCLGPPETATTQAARGNRSYGLTTMRNRHVEVDSSSIRFTFRGKAGVAHEVDIEDGRLARIVGRCQDLPGQELFEFIDNDGTVQDVDSGAVNEYLRKITGQDFTAKYFRTWAGTVLAALALQEFEAFDSQTQAKKNVVRAIESVAKRLGNTPSVCRKCYVHPMVLDAYLDGSMIKSLRRRAKAAMDESLADLRPEEAAVMALLQNRLAREQEVRSA